MMNRLMAFPNRDKLHASQASFPDLLHTFPPPPHFIAREPKGPCAAVTTRRTYCHGVLRVQIHPHLRHGPVISFLADNLLDIGIIVHVAGNSVLGGAVAFALAGGSEEALALDAVGARARFLLVGGGG